MLFSSSKCPLPALVMWCRTLKHSLGAGLDPLKIFKQMGKSGPRALRTTANEIHARLQKGDSLEDAFKPHQDRFPPLFVELIAVGEQSGRLEAVFHELESYYETTLRVQRDFRSHMAYPAIQFVAAVFIISGMIFVLGMLGSKMDPLRLGLTGTTGAITFMLGAFIPVLVMLYLFKLSANSVKWRCYLEGMCLMIPVWGPALKSFALHRFCIALGMCSEAALRAEKVLYYSFRATANSVFMRGMDHAIAVVKKGGEIQDALAASGAPFPDEFREAIMVAEETGNMLEVTERLAKNYLEDGSRQLKQAAQYTSYAIYAGVALMIIFAIFSIATSIGGVYNDATKGL